MPPPSSRDPPRLTLRRWIRARRSAFRGRRLQRSRDWLRPRSRRSSAAPAFRERSIDSGRPTGQSWGRKACSRRREPTQRRSTRRPPRREIPRAPAPRVGSAAGGGSALASAPVEYGGDLLSSVSRAAISPSMTSGSRRASRLTGAPVGPAGTSSISSSTIASRSRFTRALYTGRPEGRKPAELFAQRVKKSRFVGRFGNRDAGRAKRL